MYICMYPSLTQVRILLYGYVVCMHARFFTKRVYFSIVFDLHMRHQCCNIKFTENYERLSYFERALVTSPWRKLWETGILCWSTSLGWDCWRMSNLTTTVGIHYGALDQPHTGLSDSTWGGGSIASSHWLRQVEIQYNSCIGPCGCQTDWTDLLRIYPMFDTSAICMYTHTNKQKCFHSSQDATYTLKGQGL